jgi:hypothetical protein
MKRVAFLASLLVGIVAIAVYVWADHYTPSYVHNVMKRKEVLC